MQVGYCDPAVVSSELSYGGGPRALTYKWKAEDHMGELLTSRVPPVALSTFLSISVYETDTPYTFTFDKFDLRPNNNYTISLLAQNFLGLRDKMTWVLQKSDVPLPNVIIDGADTQITTRNKPMRLNGYAELAVCLAQNPLDFVWTILPSVPSGYEVDVSVYEKTKYSRSLYIPEDTLQVGENYTLLLWGAYRPGYIDGLSHAYNNTGEVTIMVVPGDLVARISGGNRMVSASKVLELEGGESTDQDSMKEAMKYMWACEMRDEKATKEAAEDVEVYKACTDHRNMTQVALGTAPAIALSFVPTYDSNLTIHAGQLADPDLTGQWCVDCRRFVVLYQDRHMFIRIIKPRPLEFVPALAHVDLACIVVAGTASRSRATSTSPPRARRARACCCSRSTAPSRR